MTIGNSVTNLGESAFDWCSSLTSVTLPASVTSIGSGFLWCDSLTNFSVNGANPNYASAGGVLFNQALTSLVEYPAGLAGRYVIPDGVTSIGVSAFVGCFSLTTVTIPTTVNNLGDSTFEYCYTLTNVLIPNGVTKPGQGFQLTLDWASNTMVVVEASTNLFNWTPLSTNPLVNGTGAFTDST